MFRVFYRVDFPRYFLVVLLIALWPNLARAVGEELWVYSVSNLPYQTFKTLGAAEAAMRAVPQSATSPATTLYSMLEYDSVTRVNSTAVDRHYTTTQPATAGPWEYGGIGGGGPYASEEESIAALRADFARSGCALSIAPSGAWTHTDSWIAMWTPPALVEDTMAHLSGPQQRYFNYTYSCSNGASGTQTRVRMNRSHTILCPQYYSPAIPVRFTGPDGIKTDIPVSPGCRNGTTATISATNLQYCPKDTVGNPCSPATGNKSHSETDYSSNAGMTFGRSYSSRQDAPATLQFGVGWSHSFSARLVMLGNTANPLAAVRASGYLVPWNVVATDSYVSSANDGLRLQKQGTQWVMLTHSGDREYYDAWGQLLRRETPTGQNTHLGYDAERRLTTVTGHFGQSLTFNYNAHGKLATVTQPDGSLHSYSYDTLNNLVRADFPDGTATRYHYENPSLPHHLTGLSHVSSGGTISRYATYGYDAYGRAVSTAHASVGGGAQEQFVLSYDSENQATVTDAVGNQEVLTFTNSYATGFGVKNLTSKLNRTDNKTVTQRFAYYNLTQRTDEEGRTTTYTYNPTNQRLSMTEASGTSQARTTSYQYLSPALDLPTVTESPSVHSGSTKRVSISYTNNLPTTITQSGFTPTGAAVSRAVSLTYNALGQVTSIDGPRTDVNDVTTLTYNTCTTGGGCGQLRAVTNAVGHITTYDSYDANGRLLQMTDPNGVSTAYTYDPRGRVKTLTQTAPGAVIRVTTYTYDAVGNVIATTLPTGLTLTYSYDAANYLRRVTDSLGAYIDYGYDLKGNRTKTYTYDASGTLVRSVDLAFNARNRVSQLNAGGSITQQVWDAVGNVTAVTDPNTVAANGTAVTSNGYDALNRLLSSVDLLSGNTHYSYDPNDRLKTVQAPNGSVTQYQYDDLGNLINETSPDRGTTTYTYDTAGNLTSQTDARGITVGFAYDALNRLAQLDYPGTNEDVTYTYDSAPDCALGIGRLCHVTDAGGISLYSYDGFGNVTLERRTELNVIYHTRYTYDSGNRITAITYPNGRVVNYTRTARGDIQTAGMLLNGVATSLLSSATYRPDGLPLTLAFGNTLTDTRTYDTQGRLTYQAVGSADTRLYTYDANGNLTNLQSLPQVGVYAYDVLDRLKQEDRTSQGTSTTTWTYDANGNRKTQNLGTYAYLANSNRLTTTPSGSITLDAAGNTTSDGSRSYGYNNAGHLSQVNGAGYSYNAKRQRSRKIVGSQGTVYHYDLGGNLLTETDASGNLLRDYVWVNSMPIAQVEAGERVSYLHGDHLNTPRLGTNASGVKVWGWEGEACGATQPTGSVTINLRFPGQHYDSESGLHYNWNRYYDPKLCRYVTSDPIGLAGGLNSFSYAYNNTLRFVDPTGLDVALPSPIGPIPVPIPIPGPPPGGTVGGGENNAPVTIPQLGRELRQLGMGMCLAVITAANPVVAIIANGGSTGCGGAANDDSYQCDGPCKNIGQYLLRRYKPGEIEHDPQRPGMALYRCDYRCPNGKTFSKEISLREGYGGCPKELTGP